MCEGEGGSVCLCRGGEGALYEGKAGGGGGGGQEVPRSGGKKMCLYSAIYRLPPFFHLVLVTVRRQVDVGVTVTRHTSDHTPTTNNTDRGLSSPCFWDTRGG